MHLFDILVIVYISSLNLFSFFLLYTQKKTRQKQQDRQNSLEQTEIQDFETKKKNKDGDIDSKIITDSKLIVTALMGGAAGIYIAMFLFKYRLRNVLFMVFIPMIIVFNIYMIILIFNANWAIIY